jgi:hypothetical protein
MWFWFSFPLWPRIVSISPCVVWAIRLSSFEKPLFISFSNFFTMALIFEELVFWHPYIFWQLIPCQMYSFSKILSLSVILFCIIHYSHVCTLLGYFCPLLPPPSSLPLPSCFQSEPVLPLSLILLKRRYKHNKEDKVFLLVEFRIAT